MTDMAESRDAPLLPKTVAYLSAFLGVGIGVLALAGPLAVWLGLGDFRLGFSLLRTANSWAPWVAVTALLIAVALPVIGKMTSRPGLGRLGSLALIGAISAGLTWYVPQTFRPPEGTPSIHDIATDPEDPLQFVAIVPLRADAPNNLDYGVMPGVESVEQHIEIQRSAYPDIVPQRFEAPAHEVFERALQAVDTLGWERIAADPESGRIEATDTTFWFRFKDDVVIEVKESTDGGTVVNARSVSRVGRGDVGKNADRLRELFTLLRADDSQSQAQ